MIVKIQQLTETSFPVKRAILVAFDFPPLNSGGMMRNVRHANQLAAQGFQVTVVTANHTDQDDPGLEPATQSLVDRAVRVLNVPLGPPLKGLHDRLVNSGYLFHTDEVWARWKGPLTKTIERLVETQRPDVVFVSMPPFSLSALFELNHKPSSLWIADLRDAWSQWLTTPYPSAIHYLYRLFRERLLLKRANLTTVTSKVTLRELARLHPSQAHKLYYAPNSFEEYLTDRFQQLNPRKDKLRLLYVGSFYYNPTSQRLFDLPWYGKKPHQWLQYSPRKEDWSYRSPRRLFQLLSKLKDHQVGRKIELLFAGTKPQWWEEMMSPYGIFSQVRHVGRLSKESTLELIMEADALLVTSSKVIGGPDYSVAGKTFEYFAARKPIIGLVCRGAQKELLRNSGVAICLDPDAPEKSAERLTGFLEGREHLKPDLSFLENHRTEKVVHGLLNHLRRMS